MLTLVASTPTLVRFFFFVMNGCWALTHASSAVDHVEMIMWVLTFLLLMWCVMLMDLPVLNHPYDLGMNPAWLWCMNFSKCCWIWLRIFHENSSKILGYNFLKFC